MPVTIRQVMLYMLKELAVHAKRPCQNTKIHDELLAACYRCKPVQDGHENITTSVLQEEQDASVGGRGRPAQWWWCHL